MAIRKNDYIEIQYTGWLKDDMAVFDTTDENAARENGVFDPKMEYGPVIVCVGELQVLPGIDEELIGKDVGEYDMEFPPEKAFGKKDAKLIQLIPTGKFKKQNINPQPGMQVNIDDAMGIVRTVTGGRTLVDFNHPLSGKDVKYNIKIQRIVTDDKEKAESYLRMALRLKDTDVETKDGEATITTDIELPKEFTDMLSQKMKETIGFKSVKFKAKPKKKKEE